MKLRYLAACLMISACATNASHDPLGEDKDVPENIQAQQHQLVPQDPDALINQDMGYLTHNEALEHDQLAALQSETDKSVRSPAVENETNKEKDTQESAKNAAATVAPKSEDLFNADKYAVQKGDTLSKIAVAHYGHAHDWKKIAALNPALTNPNNLAVGQVVYLPKENAESHEEAQLTPLAQPTNDIKEEKADTAPAAAATAQAAPAEASEVAADTAKESPEANREPAAAKYDDIDAAAENTDAAPMAPEVVTGEPAKMLNTQPRNLSRIIGFLGFTLFLAVFVSFALSKPKKPN